MKKNVSRIKYLAVIVAAVAAFIVAAMWYSPLLFGNAYMNLRGINQEAMNDVRPPAGELIGEFIRNLIVAYVLARFIVQQEAVNLKNAIGTGLWVWIGFQAMLLLGGVLHEQMPFKLYAIHAGDALVKTLIMAAILGAWHRKRTLDV